jgi:hypothetical protein
VKYTLLTGLILLAQLVASQPGSEASGGDFSVITIRKPDFRILSDAYIRVPEVSGMIFSQRFNTDTTHFDQRFESFNYCRVSQKNVHPRTGRIQNTCFRVLLVKNKVDNHLCFTFYLKPGTDNSRWIYFPKNPYGYSISKLCPEYRPYRNFVWSQTQPSTRKEFRHMLGRNRWYDIRLGYEEGSKWYTLTLKGADTVITMQVYPVRNQKIGKQNNFYPDPGKLFKQYQKSLNKTRKRFDARIDKEIAKQIIRDQNRWTKAFDHFSDEEKRMSREEWNAYVMKIMENEAEYLPDAPFYPSLLKRYLVYNGFTVLVPDVNTDLKSGRCRLSNDSLTRKITWVMYIDTLKMRVIDHCNPVFDSPMTFLCPFKPGNELAALFILNDGTIAVATGCSYDALRNEYLFQAESYDIGFITVGMVLDLLGL